MRVPLGWLSVSDAADTRAPGSFRLADAQRDVAAELDRIAPVIDDLGRRFTDAGHELALVGGPVRDALLGRRHNDLDLTTSARPDDIERLLAGWADTTWDIGRAFGTIGSRKGDFQVEITTYRSDAYDPSSRKPAVDFGDTLEGDLGRRDFTVNSMAVRVPSREFVDPFGGVIDLAQARLRTPGRPEDSFSDDPLRMMRAARFAAQLGFLVDEPVVEAMRAMAERITIISAERVRDELVKLVMSPHPRLGLRLLVETGLADHVLPELPALALERDEHHRCAARNPRASSILPARTSSRSRTLGRAASTWTANGWDAACSDPAPCQAATPMAAEPRATPVHGSCAPRARRDASPSRRSASSKRPCVASHGTTRQATTTAW